MATGVRRLENKIIEFFAQGLNSNAPKNTISDHQVALGTKNISLDARGKIAKRPGWTFKENYGRLNTQGFSFFYNEDETSKIVLFADGYFYVNNIKQEVYKEEKDEAGEIIYILVEKFQFQTVKRVFSVFYNSKMYIFTRTKIIVYDGIRFVIMKEFIPDANDVQSYGYNLISPTPTDDVKNVESTVLANKGIALKRINKVIAGEETKVRAILGLPSGSDPEIKFEFYNISNPDTNDIIETERDWKLLSDEGDTFDWTPKAIGIYQIRSIVRNAPTETETSFNLAVDSEAQLDDIINPTSDLLHAAPYGVVYNQRLYIFGLSEEILENETELTDEFKYRIYYSNIGKFNYVATNNYFKFTNHRNEQFTNGIVFKGNRLVFNTRSSTFVAQGDGPSSFYLKSFSENRGCIAEMGAVEKEEKLIFPGEKAIYEMLDDKFVQDELYMQTISKNKNQNAYDIEDIYNGQDKENMVTIENLGEVNFFFKKELPREHTDFGDNFFHMRTQAQLEAATDIKVNANFGSFFWSVNNGGYLNFFETKCEEDDEECEIESYDKKFILSRTFENNNKFYINTSSQIVEETFAIATSFYSTSIDGKKGIQSYYDGITRGTKTWERQGFEIWYNPVRKTFKLRANNTAVNIAGQSSIGWLCTTTTNSVIIPDDTKLVTDGEVVEFQILSIEKELQEIGLINRLKMNVKAGHKAFLYDELAINEHVVDAKKDKDVLYLCTDRGNIIFEDVKVSTDLGFIFFMNFTSKDYNVNREFDAKKLKKLFTHLQKSKYGEGAQEVSIIVRADNTILTGKDANVYIEKNDVLIKNRGYLKYSEELALESNVIVDHSEYDRALFDHTESTYTQFRISSKRVNTLGINIISTSPNPLLINSIMFSYKLKISKTGTKIRIKRRK